MSDKRTKPPGCYYRQQKKRREDEDKKQKNELMRLFQYQIAQNTIQSDETESTAGNETTAHETLETDDEIEGRINHESTDGYLKLNLADKCVETVSNPNIHETEGTDRIEPAISKAMEVTKYLQIKM